MRINIDRFNTILVVFTFVFLMISKSLAGSVFSTIFSLLLVIVACSCFFCQAKYKSEGKFNLYSLLLLIYFLLVVASLLRQFILTDLSFIGLCNIFIFLFAMLLVLYLFQSKLQGAVIETNLITINKSVNLYLFINLLLFILSVQKDRDTGLNATLMMLGIDIQRVHFFFAPSIAYLAMLCGVSIIINVFFYLKAKKIKYIFFGLISVISMILTDARGPIFGLIIVLILVFSFRKIWLKNQFLLFSCYFFSASLFVSILFLLDEYVFDVNSLARKDATLLSNREVIWKIFFENYDPSTLNFIFGYGNVGQKISGLSLKYDHLFAGWPNPTEISLHNNFLQMLVDVGILGIIIFFVLVYMASRNSIKLYLQSKNVIYLIVPAVINYILILGFSDIVTNISNIGVYFVLTSLLLSFSIVNIKSL